MRPVERGPWPILPDGRPIQFPEYPAAKPHLLTRLGRFCSYCEMPIRNMPAAEHVLPKVHHGEMERMWCNLLLACGCCNSTKGADDAGRDAYVWPDADNTALAFSYSEAGIRVKEGLPADLCERAERTFRMIGLDKRPGGEREPSHVDQRFKDRREAWDLACMSREDLRNDRSPVLVRHIVELARATGFWSVWMTVFEDDAEMRGRFIQGFEGTASDCFDDRTLPIRRRGGIL